MSANTELLNHIINNTLVKKLDRITIKHVGVL